MAVEGDSWDWALLPGEAHRIQLKAVIHRKQEGILALTNQRVIFQTPAGERTTIPLASVAGTRAVVVFLCVCVGPLRLFLVQYVLFCGAPSLEGFLFAASVDLFLFCCGFRVDRIDRVDRVVHFQYSWIVLCPLIVICFADIQQSGKHMAVFIMRLLITQANGTVSKLLFEFIGDKAEEHRTHYINRLHIQRPAPPSASAATAAAAPMSSVATTAPQLPPLDSSQAPPALSVAAAPVSSSAAPASSLAATAGTSAGSSSIASSAPAAAAAATAVSVVTTSSRRNGPSLADRQYAYLVAHPDAEQMYRELVPKLISPEEFWANHQSAFAVFEAAAAAGKAGGRDVIDLRGELELKRPAPVVRQASVSASAGSSSGGGGGVAPLPAAVTESLTVEVLSKDPQTPETFTLTNAILKKIFALSTPATGRPDGSSSPTCTSTEAWSQ